MFVLGVLSVWRITHLLQAEDGPWNISIRFRRSVGNGFWGDLLDCFYCLSLWIALPVATLLGDLLIEKILLWPALSAGSILLQCAVNNDQKNNIQYFQDKEDGNGML